MFSPQAILTFLASKKIKSFAVFSQVDVLFSFAVIHPIKSFVSFPILFQPFLSLTRPRCRSETQIVTWLAFQKYATICIKISGMTKFASERVRSVNCINQSTLITVRRPSGSPLDSVSSAKWRGVWRLRIHLVSDVHRTCSLTARRECVSELSFLWPAR